MRLRELHKFHHSNSIKASIATHHKRKNTPVCLERCNAKQLVSVEHDGLAGHPARLFEGRVVFCRRTLGAQLLQVVAEQVALANKVYIGQIVDGVVLAASLDGSLQRRDERRCRVLRAALVAVGLALRQGLAISNLRRSTL